jgi:hypothetical protein
MALVDTTHATYIGNDLKIDLGNYSVPGDWLLPKKLCQRSVIVQARGGVLGRRWYLTAWGRDDQPRGIDMVSTEAIDGSYEIMEAFLAHHGYQCVDEAAESIYSQ